MKKLLLAISLCLILTAIFGACAKQEEQSTEPAKKIMQKSDPAEDDVFNLLMVGHSGCYYYTDELYSVAKAAGVKMRVCNVYYSGCPLEKHWEWWKNGEANYDFYVIDDTGKKEFNQVDLVFCMEQYNWDAITLMENSKLTRKDAGRDAFADKEKYIRDLFGYFKEQYPKSEILWHHAWVYQVGYDGTEINGYKVDTVEEQTAFAARRKEFAMCVVEKFGVRRVPAGDAWQIVRTEYGYDNLCARLGSNGGKGDNSHDGDTGGGQYLNACVWLETLTGKSCIGNTWRPSYALDEELIPKLQQAAHKAVEEMNKA
ncbi:MAG: DUF4886 domain-containing protein [Oscillospiraceae bacterium]|nr:DUF4886 domain-containing protein [Oscillospiraceae bacterium]